MLLELTQSCVGEEQALIKPREHCVELVSLEKACVSGIEFLFSLYFIQGQEDHVAM